MQTSRTASCGPIPHGNASQVLLVCGSGIVGASFCDGLCAIEID